MGEPPCLLLHVVVAMLMPMYDLRQSPCASTATCQFDSHHSTDYDIGMALI